MSARTNANSSMFDADRQRLAAIVDSSDDAIISKDLNGIVTSWNKAAERIFGYTAEEMIGRPISTLAPPELKSEMGLVLSRIRRGQRIEHYETIRQRKDGQRIHVSLTVSPLYGASGEIIGASKIARDITDRRNAEAERTRLLELERTTRESAERTLAQHRDLEDKLSVLVEASSALLGSLDREEVLRQILVLAQRFIAADAYAIWRAARQGPEWRIVGSSGFRSEEGSGAAFGSGQGIAGELLVVPDVMVPPLLSARRSFYEAEGIRSLLMAPMCINGAFSGSITLYFRTTHDFTTTEQRVITALANLASSAVSNAELYQQQARLRQDAELSAQRSALLAQASVALGSSLDYHVTLRDVARLAVPQFADWSAVDILGPDGRLERLAVQHVDPERIALAQELRAALSDGHVRR